MRNRRIHWAAATSVALSACLLLAQTDQQAEFDLAGTDHWVDTEIDVQPGDRIMIEATGELTFPQSQPNGPNGLPRGWKDLLRILPVNEAGRGALVGRIGGTESALPFLVGARQERKAAIMGRLFLGINQQENETADGTYHVTVSISRAPASASAPRAAPLPLFTKKLLDRIPARVTDADGELGDRVNFVIVGSESNMNQAFEGAGWVKVDRTMRDAVLHGLLASLSKQAYTQLPMSELFLFGRPQDYGYAHAEPLAVAASRHHLRLWKTPFRAGSGIVWAGAATHDIGFETDQRNGKLTHKIDPAVDDEREYVKQTLSETGLVAETEYMTPSRPVKDAHTATGGSFHSDGRTLILYLTPDGAGNEHTSR